jgi:hypothetical protein
VAEHVGQFGAVGDGWVVGQQGTHGLIDSHGVVERCDSHAHILANTRATINPLTYHLFRCYWCSDFQISPARRPRISPPGIRIGTTILARRILMIPQFLLVPDAVRAAIVRAGHLAGS